MLEGFGGMREWIISVVAICMFALFVELLAPDSDLGKHVRMVMGFTIILFLVKPLVSVDLPGLMSGSLTRRLEALSALERTTPGSDTESVVADGRKLAEDSTASVTAEGFKGVEEQLESALELLGGLDKVDVGISSANGKDIDGAKVFYSGSNKGPKAESGLKRYVGAALGLGPDRIEVRHRGV